MHKILAFFGMILLTDEIFHGSNCVRVVIPQQYFQHQRYPFREKLRRSLLVVNAIPVADMDRYLTGTMTQKRSQPDADFAYVDDFDPTQIFL